MIKQRKLFEETHQTEITYTRIEPETINYSDRSVRYKQQEADWSREGKNSKNFQLRVFLFNNLYLGRSCRHLKAGHLDKWLVVYEGKQKPIANDLINTLYNVCTPMVIIFICLFSSKIISCFFRS